MFKLADSRGSRQGVYCGPEGLYLGSAALIDRRDGRYSVRREDEVVALLEGAYGPSDDIAELSGRLRRVATHLNDANLAEAMIAAVHLKLGQIDEDAIARVVRTEALLKANSTRLSRVMIMADGQPTVAIRAMLKRAGRIIPL